MKIVYGEPLWKIWDIEASLLQQDGLFETPDKNQDLSSQNQSLKENSIVPVLDLNALQIVMLAHYNFPEQNEAPTSSKSCVV